MQRVISPAGQLRGVLKVPGDKSISHRALVLGALARGRHIIDGISPAVDVRRTKQGLRDMGCFVETMPDGSTMILANSFKREATIDAGNSGTTARLLAGLAAGIDATITIDGDDSLRKRPMERIIIPLARMGAAITCAEGGTLPMTIGVNSLRGIRYELPVASAQVKSAVLIAGLLASGATTVVEPVQTRDHTELMLRTMGVDINRDNGSITVSGNSHLKGAHISIPGDISSAAFFAAAAACLPGSDICLPLSRI